MSESGMTSKPPTGPLRWILRLPLIFYRIGLGSLLGQRFVLLRHSGRKTGKTREALVEVIGYEPDSDTYYIASAWGEKSQWYQNIQAQPDIQIQVGRRKLNAHAETLSPEAGAAVLLAYQKRHPVAARELGRLMGFDLGGGDAEELTRIVDERLPIMALHVRGER